MQENIILRCENVVKYFPIEESFLFGAKEFVKAVDGVSFDLKRGKTFGLVGESGCGKTTLGRVILRLTPATAGKIFFEGRNILDIDKKAGRELCRFIQIVFQDPVASLHPRKVVNDIVGESLRIHGLATKSEARDKVLETLKQVGLKVEHQFRYPHEFSGGQRQRIAIARALILQPKLIILDEPTSALDVSVQAKIINLLSRLKKSMGLSYLLITHDLSVIQYMTDTLAVMYLGKLVEKAPVDGIFEAPYHPYTKALLSAIPSPDPDLQKERIILKGDVPSPVNPPAGCRFHTRCPIARERCRKEVPEFLRVDGDHFAACHYAEPGHTLSVKT
ncbi:MAG: ABC transporter ATP-binding protein [Candidatus Heimdallarchaeota archaeon]